MLLLLIVVAYRGRQIIIIHCGRCCGRIAAIWLRLLQACRQFSRVIVWAVFKIGHAIRNFINVFLSAAHSISAARWILCFFFALLVWWSLNFWLCSPTLIFPAVSVLLPFFLLLFCSSEVLWRLICRSRWSIWEAQRAKLKWCLTRCSREFIGIYSSQQRSVWVLRLMPWSYCVQCSLHSSLTTSRVIRKNWIFLSLSARCMLLLRSARELAIKFHTEIHKNNENEISERRTNYNSNYFHALHSDSLFFSLHCYSLVSAVGIVVETALEGGFHPL